MDITHYGSGSQRLSLQQLQAWESLKFGLFLHFGMSTFEGLEESGGTLALDKYVPDQLDIDQWIRVAAQAGMRYAVLTCKHISGFCLWPSEYTDYHVGNSPVSEDIVAAFVAACRKYGLLPGLYYCSWDNHHTFGSITKSNKESEAPFLTDRYLEFQTRQVTELMSNYGQIAEVWIDIPILLPRAYRHKLYDLIASLQPQALIMMNSGIGDWIKYPVAKAWPSDLVAIERFLPNSNGGHKTWRQIEGKSYYLPAEVCDTIGKKWFYQEDDPPRSTAELLGMYLICRARKANFLLDVPPDQHGKIPDASVNALQKLSEAMQLFESSGSQLS